MPSNQYQFSVDLSLKDMEYFYFSQYTKKFFVKFMIVMAALYALMGLYILISTRDLSTISGLILPLVLFVVVPFMIKSQAKKIYNSSTDQFKNNKYTFEETGVAVKNSTSSANFTWNMVHKIEENKQQVLLFVNSAVAHVLPKRCFNSQEEEQAFLQFARQKIAASR